MTIGRPDTEAPGETLTGAFVSGNYFQMLGLSPAAGRLVQPSADGAGAAPVAVINIERLIARLTVAFGAVALLLACLGLYGVTAYAVTRRTREIGIRLAVGASRTQVLTAVLRSALLQVAVGVAIGVPAVFFAARFLRATLFGVSEYDPAVLATALAVLGTSAVVAALIPARRAAAMDPVRALRVE